MRTEEPRAVRLKDYRAPAYRISDIHLDFALEPEATRVIATTKCSRVGDPAPLVLDGEHLKLISIAIDGRVLAPGEYSVGEVTLAIAAPPERFTLEIVTEIAPAENTALEGLYLSKGMFCTQCEAEGFRRITYFLDRPDVLAVYTTRIEAEKKKFPVLLSNGNPVDSGEVPARPALRGVARSVQETMLSLRAGGGRSGLHRRQFVTMSRPQGALRIFVEHGNEERAAYAMDSLKRSMKWDEEAFGREYDLDIFMIVAVSDFNMGAMENKGLNIFNAKVLLASPETATDDDYAHIEGVVAHEYFHNWTGDRVTCRDWFQLSLKEGLTVFRDQSFSGDMRSRAVQRIQDVQRAAPAPIPGRWRPDGASGQPESYIEIDNFYTSTVYEKGAEVIGMLNTLVGEEGYRKATDLYFARHDGEAVTIEDWVTCFEDACGRDLTQFRLWYAQAGTPVIEAEGRYDAAAKTYTLTLKQSLSPTPGQPDKKPMHIPVRLGLVGNPAAPCRSPWKARTPPAPKSACWN